MSRAWGSVHLLPSGAIAGWYIYNGTSDVAHSAIFDTYEKMCGAWSHATDDSWDRSCECSAQVAAPVRIWSDYGYGFGWLGVACLSCMTIIGPLCPDQEDAPDVPSDIARRCDLSLSKHWDRPYPSERCPDSFLLIQDSHAAMVRA